MRSCFPHHDQLHCFVASPLSNAWIIIIVSTTLFYARASFNHSCLSLGPSK
uniref:Uncharacterized protein n=1 Tax=Arundo donax TaxID=35708 RepID=A0A0A8Z7Y4_ARUDO